MHLAELNILNFRNIESADLRFTKKINCLVGQNGMGKTNVLDAIYYLSFCKSVLNSTDSLNIRHEADMAMIKGVYQSNPVIVSATSDLSDQSDLSDNTETISCGLKRGQKKQFRRGKKDYKRLIEHIGLIPLVIVSPKDSELVVEGSDERRRFLDSIISQHDRTYLEHLSEYNALLKQRNTLLKQKQDQPAADDSMLEIYEQRMIPHAEYIYSQRESFVEEFVPVFQDIYNYIAEHKETVSLYYRSQLQDRNLTEAMAYTRTRDIALGWTSQGIHKDDLDMRLGDYPLKQVGSQGQQKTYLIALKLAQALWLTDKHNLLNQPVKPILLLDDIFDKLDSERVGRIVQLVNSERFGQIFITDTDRQHLTDLLSSVLHSTSIFLVSNGQITPFSI